MTNPLRLAAWLTMPVMVGCSDYTPQGGSEFTSVQDWVTEPDYEFGDAMEGDAVFGSISDVNVHSSAEGLRVYVLDGRSSEVIFVGREPAHTRCCEGRLSADPVRPGVIGCSGLLHPRHRAKPIRPPSRPVRCGR